MQPTHTRKIKKEEENVGHTAYHAGQLKAYCLYVKLMYVRVCAFLEQ